MVGPFILMNFVDLENDWR